MRNTLSKDEMKEAFVIQDAYEKAFDDGVSYTLHCIKELLDQKKDIEYIY